MECPSEPSSGSELWLRNYVVDKFPQVMDEIRHTQDRDSCHLVRYVFLLMEFGLGSLATQVHLEMLRCWERPSKELLNACLIARRAMNPYETYALMKEMDRNGGIDVTSYNAVISAFTFYQAMLNCEHRTTADLVTMLNILRQYDTYRKEFMVTTLKI